MYDNIVTSVHANDSGTNTFAITVRLRKGPSFSPYNFSLVMDEVMKDILGDIPLCMHFLKMWC
jgi:hypothetical protein